jgi:hypothetical protein
MGVPVLVAGLALIGIRPCRETWLNVSFHETWRQILVFGNRLAISAQPVEESLNCDFATLELAKLMRSVRDKRGSIAVRCNNLV